MLRQIEWWQFLIITACVNIKKSFNLSQKRARGHLPSFLSKKIFYDLKDNSCYV